MKFKERFKRFSKEFYAQFDITFALGLKSFDYKDFEVYKDFSIKLKGKCIKSVWSVRWFEHTFESKEVLCDFMFFYYKRNFYPQGSHFWSDNSRVNYSRNLVILNQINAFTDEYNKEPVK